MACPFRSIVFDFDYTLADSSRGAVECVNYALTSLGLPKATPEAIHQTIGLSLNDILLNLGGQYQPAKTEAFAAFFKKRADEIMAGLTILYETVPFLAVLSGVTPKITFDHYPKVGVLENLSQLADYLVS